MTGHPPFLIPQENGCIDLNHPPDDAAFWKLFKELHPLYGVTEGILYTKATPLNSTQDHLTLFRTKRIKCFIKHTVKKKLSINIKHISIFV